MTQTIQPVVLIWGFHTGYSYVGPFATMAAANDWALRYDELTGLLDWHSELVDPAVPLALRPPDLPWEVTDVLPGAAFFMLMPDSEPVHLVGPFATPRAAYIWGCHHEKVRRSDVSWHIIRVEDPAAVPRLLTGDEAIAAACTD
jgi:hypothetical protein